MTLSFLAKDTVGGRPARYPPTKTLGDLLYLGRWENFWNLTSATGLKAGANVLHGPNSTGGDAQTWIYGLDLKLRWCPEQNFRGWPFFLWQTEVHERDYTVSRYVEPALGVLSRAGATTEPTLGAPKSHTAEWEEDSAAPAIPGTILRDAGIYSQVLYGFPYGWAAGLRVEYASGKGSDFLQRSHDPLRNDRWRLSSLLVWHLTNHLPPSVARRAQEGRASTTDLLLALLRSKARPLFGRSHRRDRGTAPAFDR